MKREFVCAHCGRDSECETWQRHIFCSRKCRGQATAAKHEQRFWSYVDKRGSDECWLWRGGILKTGYGHFNFLERGHRAHRYAYQLAVGPIPDGLFVLHKCDVRHCVNPAHLWLGTQKENLHDMIRKGRHAAVVCPETFARGERQGASKLNTDSVILMRRLRARGWPFTVIGKFFGVGKYAARHACLGLSWAHVE